VSYNSTPIPATPAVPGGRVLSLKRDDAADKSGLRPTKESIPESITLELEAKDLVSYDTGGIAGVTVGARIDPEWFKLINDIITVGRRLGEFPSNPTEFVRNAIVLYAKILLKANVLEDGEMLRDIQRRVELREYERDVTFRQTRQSDMEKFTLSVMDQVTSLVKKGHLREAHRRVTKYVSALEIYLTEDDELGADLLESLARNTYFQRALDDLNDNGFPVVLPGVSDPDESPDERKPRLVK
jgi:hypothetical protein